MCTRIVGGTYSLWMDNRLSFPDLTMQLAHARARSLAVLSPRLLTNVRVGIFFPTHPFSGESGLTDFAQTTLRVRIRLSDSSYLFTY